MARERQQSGSGDFGDHLRQAREGKGVSLRTIADTTRISVAALEALERNDISRLPGGIFTRAFVRSYAYEVGLDPEATVEEFVRRFPDDSVTVGHPTTVRPDALDGLHHDRRAATLGMILMALAVPIVALAIYFSLYGWPWRTPPPASPPAPTAAVSPVARPTRIIVELVAKTACALSFVTDGQAGVDVSLPTGSHRTIEALGAVALTVSDAEAVEMHINGALARALGPAGAPATVTITLDNIRALLVEP